MVGFLLLIATWVGGTFGFGLLALSQKPHWASLMHGASDQPPDWLPSLGWVSLGLAVLPAVRRDGLALGLLCWCMLLTLSALTIAVLLTRLSLTAGRHKRQ